MGNYVSVFTHLEEEFIRLTTEGGAKDSSPKIYLSMKEISQIILPDFPVANNDLLFPSSHGPRIQVFSKQNRRPGMSNNNNNSAGPSPSSTSNHSHQAQKENSIDSTNSKTSSNHHHLSNHHNNTMFNHLPLLYVMDQNSKDGRVDLVDIRVFSEFVSKVSLREAQLMQLDFGEMLKAMCLLEMKKDFENSLKKTREREKEKTSHHQNEKKPEDADDALVNAKIGEMISALPVDEKRSGDEHDDQNEDDANFNFPETLRQLNLLIDIEKQKKQHHINENRNVVTSWILAFISFNCPEDELQHHVRSELREVMPIKDEEQIEQFILLNNNPPSSEKVVGVHQQLSQKSSEGDMGIFSEDVLKALNDDDLPSSSGKAAATSNKYNTNKSSSSSKPAGSKSKEPFSATSLIFWRWFRQERFSSTKVQIHLCTSFRTTNSGEHIFGLDAINFLYQLLNRGSGIHLPCGSPEALFDLLSRRCSMIANTMIGMMQQQENDDEQQQQSGQTRTNNDDDNHTSEEAAPPLKFVTTTTLEVFLNEMLSSVFTNVEDWNLDSVGV